MRGCSAQTHRRKHRSCALFHLTQINMMKLPSLLLLTLFPTLGLGGVAKPNLNKPKKLEKILEEAIDHRELESRSHHGELLVYIRGSQKPFSGWFKRMRASGAPSLLCQYKNGMRHGLQINWHENGQKRREVHYAHGKRNGRWTEWRENGSKRHVYNYEGGELHGTLTGWFENGQKCFESNYLNGRKHGPLTTWDSDGEIRYQGVYTGGLLQEKIKQPQSKKELYSLMLHTAQRP